MSYHEEQETIDSLKHWWSRWGNVSTWVILIVLLGYAGWNGWHYWQRRQSASAAVLYDQLQQARTANDKQRVARIASDMENSYSHTAYAQMTALEAARSFVDAGDAAAAKAQLQWAVDHADDDSYKAIAQIRLAGLLLDEKSYDAGLALLSGTPPKAFAGAWADRRGDLLAALGKRSDAATAYRAALASLEADDGSARQLVQFKLDALGV
ncbi:MAG: YfgM family protein [Janthinobacterium lividum]